ncbi:MAG: hypothetical protein U0R49_00480 [Fimbriimonadales bacterium]
MALTGPSKAMGLSVGDQLNAPSTKPATRGYDRNLTSSKAIWSAIEYLHENPVRHGLVQHPTDWRWSSARFYAGMSCEEIEEDQCDV